MKLRWKKVYVLNFLYQKQKIKKHPKKNDMCLPPKKRKQFSGSEIVTSRKALKFGEKDK